MIYNVNFDLPANIIKGLAENSYKIFGGVVRDQKGHIIAHLQEVAPVIGEQGVKILAKAASKNKCLLGIGIGAAVATVAGLGVQLAIKTLNNNNEKTVKDESPKAIEDTSKVIDIKSHVGKKQNCQKKKVVV